MESERKEERRKGKGREGNGREGEERNIDTEIRQVVASNRGWGWVK